MPCMQRGALVARAPPERKIAVCWRYPRSTSFHGSEMYRWILRFVAGIRVRIAFLLVRLLPRVSTKHDVLGMHTYLALPHSEDVLRAKEQLNLSITLIAHYEPRRFARLKADLRGVLVYPFAASPRARYNRSTGYCELSPSLALSNDIVTIASSIVHEGTHARLRRVGKRDPEGRLRVERVCVSEQIAFLDNLPGMAHRAAKIRGVLEGLRVDDYTDAALWADTLGDWQNASETWRQRS